MPLITINGNSIDPEAPARHTFGFKTQNPESKYILIQPKTPLTKDQKNKLQADNVEILEYVDEDTYLCSCEPEKLKDVRNLDFVRYADVYDNSFVIQASLKGGASGAAGAAGSSSAPVVAGAPFTRQPHNVDIILHANVDVTSTALKEAISKAAHVDGNLLSFSGSHEKEGALVGGKVRVSVQERYLDALAAIDEVAFIQEVHATKLRNDVARAILNADVMFQGTNAKGKGEVVAVADTGFDTGDRNNPHPAFTGRIQNLYSLGRPTAAKSDDPVGHGTHVCGSVAGDGTSNDMGQTTLHGRIEAPASEANLVIQSLVDENGNLGGIPTNLGELFLQPYTKDGARIHTNSWGSSPNPGSPVQQLPYDSSAKAIDKFVYDHPDMVICFAAGNDGVDRDRNGAIDLASIGAEAAAKNCITVGASESLRPSLQRPNVDYTVPPGHPANTPYTWGGYWPVDYPAAPIFNDHIASNADGMAAFSSRGPTLERRFKPDIVAPGSAILSTRSRIADDEGYYGISRDPQWMFDSGTSMATPLVAGCCAVLRQTLRAAFPTPSAALVKAVLINGAVDVVGQYHPTEAGSSPNNSSGFGRVNLADSVITPGSQEAGCDDNKVGLDTGETFQTTVTIPSTKTLKVTLAYSDKEGPKLQNDLSLIVVAPNGNVERHGNMGTREFQIGSRQSLDHLNNVEQVVWSGLQPGKVTIKVIANRVTTLVPQTFAYAWRIL